MTYLYLILGLVLILVGAHFLVDGSTAVAKRLRMSEFLIGLTIVGIGTSMPEMVVSMIGTINGSGTVAIGNVVGSNIANVLLILGVTALIKPVPMDRNAMHFDIPYCLMLSVALTVIAYGFTFWHHEAGIITRPEGIILLVLFVLFIMRSFRNSKQTMAFEAELSKKSGHEDTGHDKQVKMWLAAIMIFGGLGGLIFGGRLFVSGAVGIAHALGVSEAIIAITIMAAGTSMPELATSAVAAFKGKTQLALGNIIGSNISNISLILGLCAVVNPLKTGGISVTDMYVMLLAVLLVVLSIFTFRKKTIDRPEGAIMILIYCAYIYILAAKPGLLNSILVAE